MDWVLATDSSAKYFDYRASNDKCRICPASYTGGTSNTNTKYN